MAKQTNRWHNLDVAAVLGTLGSSETGLSEEEAQTRLESYGANRLQPPHRPGAIVRFALQFHNVLIYVLVVAGVVTALLGHWVDSGVIAGVVLINALIGVIQEGKAEKSLDAIRNMLSHQALTRRDGRLRPVDAVDLVPGDIVSLQSGDKVPADLRLLSSRDLHIDESILTGESVPSAKATGSVDLTTPIADRTCIAYSGTVVTSGQAQGIVVATGAATEIGRISEMLSEVQPLTTPLLRQIARFARWLTGAILLLAGATLAFGVLVRGYSATEMFLAAVGLAVAAIPEGLPAIMTITLAIGVQRMARRNAIIRRLPAVETLGSVSVICSDKTGTLTRNEMTVREVATAEAVFEVSGVGYDPHGSFTMDDGEVDPQSDAHLSELTRAGLLCNDAMVNQQEGDWLLTGDPTEGALVTLGLKAGHDPTLEREQWPRTDVIPFESEHRFMASLHHDHAGHGLVFLKGAPERVLEMCAWQGVNDRKQPLIRSVWLQRMQAMGARGQRLLAIAAKPAAPDQRGLCFADVEDGLSLLGLVGMIDPPREEAIAAVQRCHDAGIVVKVITGDHAATATAIASSMGIGDGSRALTGNDLETLSDSELLRTAQHVDVFARASPEHKLRLVGLLQASGQVVAMTGDGVNDAPALKRADVGIAMGCKGTEVAKEAAEMVLVDDNFASIAHAVEEGRTVYDNLKKAILFVLPTNGGEALCIMGAVALGQVLPITAVQILWINMITAVTLALALAFEPAERNVMRRPPRDAQEPLLSGFLLWRISFVSLILVCGTFGLFLWHQARGGGIEESRTVAVNTLVAFEIFYLWNARSLTGSMLGRHALIGNRYALYATGLLIVFQLLYTYLPPMQALFSSRPLAALEWLPILLVASSVFVLVEFEKCLLRGLQRRRGLKSA